MALHWCDRHARHYDHVNGCSACPSKELADAKAEGRREGLLAAKKACDDISDRVHWPASATADACSEAIGALLPPAPGESEER